MNRSSGEKVGNQIQFPELSIRYTIQLGDGAVRQVFQLLLVLIQIGTHFHKGVNQSQTGAGIVDAHKLLFFKGKIFRVQISFSFDFRGLDLRWGCCG